MALFNLTDTPWLQKLGWFAVEIIIVFIGVYGAFQLDQWQADRRLEARQQQAYDALHHLLTEYYVEGMDQSRAAIDSVYIEGFLTPYEQGEQPMPVPFEFYGTTINTGAWEAILAAGGVDALDVAFLYEIEVYFSLLEDTVERADVATALSTERLLPRMDEGTDAFYDAETGKLKTVYQWYPDQIRLLSSSIRLADQRTDSLLVRIEHRMPPR